MSTSTAALLALARHFDAIDLSECKRRLASGEPLDDACNAAIEQRQAICEEMKALLGERLQEFDAAYAPLAERSALDAHPLTCWRRPNWPYDAGPAVEALTAMGLVFAVSPDHLPSGTASPCHSEATPRIEHADGTSIQFGMPNSCAGAVLGMIHECTILTEATETEPEETNPELPVRVLAGGKKYAVARVEMRGGEILLKCE